MSKYEKMYLISEQEYNAHLIQPTVILPSYKTPVEKGEKHSFKMLGEKYDLKANQLYKEILKYWHVNDRNEWFEKHDDTLPISSTNIVDLISYAIKSTLTDQPYGWNTFVEYLKSHKDIPRTLLNQRAKDDIKGPVTVAPVATPAAPVDIPTPIVPSHAVVISKEHIPHQKLKLRSTNKKGSGFQIGKGFKIYF